MKHTEMLVVNGVIFNEIMDVVEKAKINNQRDVLVICHDNEIFDQAMATLANRYGQKVSGVITVPNAGDTQRARRTTVSVYYDILGFITKLDVMTKAEYEADKAAIDAKFYNARRTIMSTGGSR